MSSSGGGVASIAERKEDKSRKISQRERKGRNEVGGKRRYKDIMSSKNNNNIKTKKNRGVIHVTACSGS